MLEPIESPATAISYPPAIGFIAVEVPICTSNASFSWSLKPLSSGVGGITDLVWLNLLPVL